MSVELPKTEEMDRLRRDLAELGQWLESAPESVRAKAKPILERIVQDTQRRRTLLLSIQESLSQLLLDMKYLVFDLEATRRERDCLRRQLEGESGETGQ